MDHIPVKSSTIVSVAYDAASATMEIMFHNGSIYQYSDVPASVAQGLIKAPSTGKYFDAHVKKAGYRYVQIA